MYPGLPNITGEATAYVTSVAFDRTGCSGALSAGVYELKRAANYVDNTIPQYTGGATVTMDASRSSAEYGRATTVTPRHVKYQYVIQVYHKATSVSTAQATEFVNQVASLRSDVPSIAAKSAMPGNGRHIQVSIPSGTSYPMPNDGYLHIAGTATTTSAFIAMYSSSGLATIMSQSVVNATVRCHIMALKGTVIDCAYGSITNNIAYFIPADGVNDTFT